MGTYDTVGGTPRHDPAFDDDGPPCDTCTEPCKTCGNAMKDCECETRPNCDMKCTETTPR